MKILIYGATIPLLKLQKEKDKRKKIKEKAEVVDNPIDQAARHVQEKKRPLDELLKPLWRVRE